MLMILLAIIGVKINAGVLYWACLCIYCVAQFCKTLVSIVDEGKANETP